MTPSPKDQWTADDESEAEAIAALNRWLDREHHRFPSHPLATSVAIVLSRITADPAAFEEINDLIRHSTTELALEVGNVVDARLANGIAGEEVGK